MAITYEANYNTFLTLAKNGLGHNTYFRLDPLTGEVLKRLDPNGHLECWTYDNQHRLLEQGRHSATVSSGSIDATTCSTQIAAFQYVNIGTPATQHMVETQYPGAGGTNIVSMRFFDGLGRTYKEAASTETNLYTISLRSWGTRGEETCMGLPFRNSDPSASTFACENQRPYRSRTYDALLRPLTTTLNTPSGSLWGEVSKPESSLVYAVEDDDGAIPGLELIEMLTVKGEYPTGTPATPDLVRRTATDVHGFRRVVQNNSGNRTVFSADALGQILRIDGPDVTREDGVLPNDKHANILALEYDLLGRRKKMIQAANGSEPPTGPTWLFSWDPNGNLTSQIPPRGSDYQISYVYDELDRPTWKDVAPIGTNSGNEDTFYTYDTQTSAFSPTFTPFSNKGYLSLVAGPGLGNDEILEHDFRGYLARKVKQISEIKHEFRYAYDQLGRRTYARYPDQVALDFLYTGPFLSSVRNHGIGTEYVGQMSYGASGRVTRLAFPSNANKVAWSEYAEDTGTLLPKQYVARINGTTAIGSGTPADGQDFRFDVAGNLRQTSTPTGMGLTDFLSESYNYDSLHRLDQAQATGTRSTDYNEGSAFLDHDYDNAGNLIKKGKWTLAYAKASAPANAVTKIISGAENLTYTYDPDGNLAARAGPFAGLQRADTLAWDADGRLRMFTVASGGQTTYTYDDQGSRTFKQLPGGQLSGSRTFVDPEYEIDPSGAFTAQIKHVFVDGRRVLSLTSNMDADSDPPGSSGYGIPDRYQCDGYSSVGWNNEGQIVNQTSYGVPDACLCGDYNNDGVITVSDVLGANNCIYTGGATPPYYEDQLHDTNGDSTCNVSDIVALNGALYAHDCNLRCGKVGYIAGQTTYDLRAICRDTNRPQTELRYHSNQIGTNRLVTDETGAIRQRTLTRPFGDLVVALDGSGNPINPPTPRASNYMFSDKYLDDESGLDYFEARYFDPVTGTFLSTDPELIGPGLGVTFSRIPDEGQNLNGYMYALARPTVVIDPTGRISIDRPAPAPWPDDCTTCIPGELVEPASGNQGLEGMGPYGGSAGGQGVSVLAGVPILIAGVMVDVESEESLKNLARSSREGRNALSQLARGEKVAGVQLTGEQRNVAIRAAKHAKGIRNIRKVRGGTVRSPRVIGVISGILGAISHALDRIEQEREEFQKECEANPGSCT